MLSVLVGFTASIVPHFQNISQRAMELFWVALFGAGTALATENLFVSSYAGALSTLALEQDESGEFTLNNVSVDLGCSPSPSWITLYKPSNTLFCIGEGTSSPNGSLNAYTYGPDGQLVQRSKVDTPNGPVYGAVYGSKNGTQAIALPNYGAGALSPYLISPNTSLSLIQNISFPAPNPPGPVPDRQAASHPHEAIVDPTGQYVLVPDLGADLVRVFGFDKATAALTPAGNPLQAAPGSGPRHAAFFVSGNATYMYLVSELGATLTGYSLTYAPNGGGLSFQQLFVSDTLGGLKPTRTVAPAEVRVAPQSNFLVLSNRNDSTFALPNNQPGNATAIPSDSLATYVIQPNGSVKFLQLWPSGGSFPRTFDINQVGDKVAVGLQNDGRIVVFDRDVQSGLLGSALAVLEGKDVGQVTRVVWDE